MRERYFRVAIEAAWTQPRCGDRLVGGELGCSIHIATPFRCDYGYNVSIGNNAIIGSNSKPLDLVKIGTERIPGLVGVLSLRLWKHRLI